MPMMRDLIEAARRELPYLTRLRRDFHRHPELSEQETRTAARIEEELDALGIPHERLGGTNVLGVLRGEGPGGGAVALRADIDALPIQEETGLPFASETEGVMHACGHDLHTACLLGAAKLLAARRARFGGEVRFLFQSAEETGGGARPMIARGALGDARRVFGLHCAPDLPFGTVGVRPGLNNAAVDLFRIEIHGKAAHVSTPQLGADALYAASQIVVAMQGLAARRTSPVEPVVLGIGRMEAGTTYNAVAEYAALEGTTRTISAESRALARERIEETARHVAAVSGAEARVIWKDVCSALVNDAGACAEVRETVEGLDGAPRVMDDRPLSLGGDNFSEYLLKIPGCYAYLGTHNPAKPGSGVGIHNGHFCPDEDAMPLGAALHAACALRWLSASD